MDKGKEIINEPFWMHPDNEKENIGNNKMNGIYIKGISMPNGGTLKIEIGYDADGYPIAICDDKNVYDVIPVPPHGRLIDADVLEAEFKKLLVQDNWYYNALHHAPTIIPADKEH